MTSPKDESEDCSFSASPPRAPWIIRFDRQQKFQFSPWARRHVPVSTWYTAKLGNIDIYPSNQPPSIIQLEGDSMMYHQMWDAPWRESFSSEEPRSFLVVYFQLPMKKMNEEKFAKQKKDQFEHINQLIRYSMMGRGPVFYFNEMCQNQLGGETWMHECVPFVYWPTDLTRSENSTVPNLSIQIPVFEVPSSTTSQPYLASKNKDIATVSTLKHNQPAQKPFETIEHNWKNNCGNQGANTASEPETMHEKSVMVKAEMMKDPNDVSPSSNGPTDVAGFVENADDGERTSATAKYFSGDVDKENLHHANINQPTKQPRRQTRSEVKKKQKKQQSAASVSKLVDPNPATLSEDLVNSPASAKASRSVSADAISIPEKEEAKKARDQSIPLETAPATASWKSSKTNEEVIGIPATVTFPIVGSAPPVANKTHAFTEAFAVSKGSAAPKATVVTKFSVKDNTTTVSNVSIIAEDCAADKAPALIQKTAASDTLTKTTVSVPAKNAQMSTVEKSLVREKAVPIAHSSAPSGESVAAKTKASVQASSSVISTVMVKAPATTEAPVSTNEGALPSKATRKNKNKNKKSKNEPKDDFSAELPNKADKKMEEAKLNFSTKFEVYKKKMDNERRFQLAFEKENFQSHDLQMKICECLKQTHPFDIHLRRKEIEEKLKERIIHYRNSKCFEYQIMEYVMETLSNCKMDLITGDCLYLYSDTSLSEKKLRALEQQYLRMVESYKDWIGNSERECVLTMEELKMNPVKLCDESWYDHFVTYMNRQALLRNNDRPSNIPEIKIEELISQMHDEECFVYKDLLNGIH
ncbi:hypothetical protein L5515_018992 [Caenorhabditis briggsae]|uniref:Uncharacterized protein n=1 Tax=Caenorhabditis briggsae TaxID=6238 RepID=A0AAE9JUX5_CAEBR|nr:hypothetical protein L5515_018992 [Caenorhabditis briggsae]